MDLSQYLTSDATTLARLVAEKEVTASELLALARQRAEQVNPKLNAIVRPLPEVADERVTEELDGPFAGVPFLVKDLAQDVAGFPTTEGSQSLEHDVATEHALITQRFLDAGLVIFGKTNTPEFGSKGITEDVLLGTARNPWNLNHTPGGSSGGSGAAVGAGIVPAAGANDGGGSVRIPAACNGLVGLKLSRGFTPYGPQTSESMFGMVTQGVVSRTVRDSAGLLDAVAGVPERYAAYVARRPDSFLENLDDRPQKLRVGYSASSAINANPDPEAIAAVEKAAALLTELGHEVEEVKPPHDDEALARDFLTIWFAQVHGQISRIKKRLGASDTQFAADTLAIAEIGRAAGVSALFGALDNINSYIHALDDFHAHVRPVPHPDPGQAAARDRRDRDAEATEGGCPGGLEGPRRQGPQRLRRHGPADLRQPRLGALHPAGQPHRPPGDQRAPALDRLRACPSACSSSARSPPTASCSASPRSSRRRSRGSSGTPSWTRPWADRRQVADTATSSTPARRRAVSASSAFSTPTVTRRPLCRVSRMAGPLRSARRSPSRWVQKMPGVAHGRIVVARAAAIDATG